jgi:hypothetical protein
VDDEVTERIPQQRPAGAEAEVARDLRFAEISGRPAPEPLPSRFNVGRLLRRCAGVHESLLAWVPTERSRYTGMGGFVLFTALMAIGSSTIALTIAFDRPWPFVVLPAVFWGVVIFNLDRWIVASPLPEHGFRRVAVFLPRLLMSVIFAVVIAEPVLLIVFKTAVNEQLDKIRADEASAYQRQLEDCNPAEIGASPPAGANCEDRILTGSTAIPTAQAIVTAAEKAAGVSDQKLDTAGADVREALRQMTSECRGQDGSQYGDGPVCKRLGRAYQTALDHRAQMDAENTKLQGALTTARASLATVETGTEKARNDEIRAKVATYQAGQDKDGGLLERIEALNKVATAHLSLLLAVWAVRLLLIAVDSIPAIAKLSSGTTTYDRLAKEAARLGEEKHKARAVVDEDEAQNWVEESAEDAEIGRAERRHQRDRAADALLLSAAQHRDQQASQFRPVVGDDQAPFMHATYTLTPPVPAEGPAPRPAPVVSRAESAPARRGKRDGSGEPDRHDPDHSEVLGHSWTPLPSISVVALGGPGSGKTTFLAQMYDTLRTNHPFTLTLSDGGPRTHLENWAETIRAPGQEWPDSTATTHLTRYDFTCRVAEDDVLRPILNLAYWDYSGEALLQNTELPGIGKLRDDLSKEIARADALLIIVDGEELRRAWDGDAEARARLLRTLTKIEVYSAPAKCPAQIVVTKWDEVENWRRPDGSLWDRATIIRALDTFEPVQALKQGRRYRSARSYGERGMRVIPVSVVGGAGSTQREGDQLVRVRGAAPVNIDIPFAGLLPDRLDQIYADMGIGAIEGQLRLARSRLRLAAARAVLNVAGWVLGALPLPGVSGVLAKLAETALTNWVPSYVLDKVELEPRRTRDDLRLLRQARKLRDGASRTGQARFKVMAAFANRLKTFDQAYPPSGRPVDHGGQGMFYSPQDDRDDRYFA